MIDKFFQLIREGNPKILEEIENIKSSKENSVDLSIEEANALNDKLSVLESENEKYVDDIYDMFIVFRIEHYNKKMEDFLKHLKNSIIIEFDEMFDTPNEERPCNEVFAEIREDRGTENDYINYINNVVSSNGNYDNKKQEICNEVNVDYSIIKEFYNSMTDIKKIAEDKYKDWHEVRLPAFVKEIEDNQPLIRANKNIQDCYDNGIRIFPDILSKYSFLSKNDLENLDDCPEDIKEIIQNRLNEFESFRYNHYNKQFEDVLTKLKLKYINELDKNSIIANGTVEDYIEYMKNYKNREENI